MTHYFHEPNSFKSVNCKKVAGERARKKCREWNAFVQKIHKLKAEGRTTEAEELERPYLDLWAFERSFKTCGKKRRK